MARFRRKNDPASAQHTVALAGHPNVGKSTLFNALTGLRQHTGNWSGKTVATAVGYSQIGGSRLRLVDLPGTYSLLTHSAEEEVARSYLCGGEAEAVMVVCDASNPDRGVALALQVMEMGHSVLLCLNLMDEARRRHRLPDAERLARQLHRPVVAVTARRKATLEPLKEALTKHLAAPSAAPPAPVLYPSAIEQSVAVLAPQLGEVTRGTVTTRWLALRLLEGTDPFPERMNSALYQAVAEEQTKLTAEGFTADQIHDALACAVDTTARRICRHVVREDHPRPADATDRRIDRLLTHRIWGYPLMLVFLLGILWLTVKGANGLSAPLQQALSWVEEGLSAWFRAMNAPAWLHGALITGAYRMLATVVAVMLPPMAIFFPLFTLLEDVGYLPRLAYNLDRPFARCGACGKQALTMCMGFGCNAAGVVGCRIIDSPRERKLATLTNSFVPCNGRFPTLLLLISVFFVGVGENTLLSALWLTGFLLLSVVVTLDVTKLLSRTLFRGAPSFFALELPPYRPPQVGQILVRSVLDRTLFVLGRAASVAAPAGLAIWGLTYWQVGDMSLLQWLAGWLDPVGQALGMDGVLLLAFILGLPANEVVLPLAVMMYTSTDAMAGLPHAAQLHSILTAAGWTPVTALCVILFSLFHWPCSTTLITVYRETKSLRQTAFAAALPTAVGVLLCGSVQIVSHLFV